MIRSMLMVPWARAARCWRTYRVSGNAGAMAPRSSGRRLARPPRRQRYGLCGRTAPRRFEIRRRQRVLSRLAFDANRAGCPVRSRVRLVGKAVRKEFIEQLRAVLRFLAEALERLRTD